MVRVKIEQDLPHLLAIVETVDLIPLRCCGLPQHDTTESLRILVHVLLDQGLDFLRRQVEPKTRSSQTSRQTDVELCIGVFTGLDDIYPLVIVEAVLRAPNKVTGRARLSVVELNPDKVNI